MKKILSLIMIFILTGCSSSYNYNFETNVETIKILLDENDYEDSAEERIDELIAINKDETRPTMNYNFTKIINENETGLSLDYRYNDTKNYLEKSEFLSCYKNIEIIDNNKVLKLFLQNYKECGLDLTNTTISFTAKGKLASTNADKIDGNTYYWEFDENKKVELIIDKTDSEYTFIYIIGIITVLALVVIVSVMQKNKKNNQI